MNSALLKNYLTTSFGVLAGLPTIVLGSGLTLNAKWSHILLIVAGIGTVGLGVVAKAFNVHSTSDQVNSATMSAQVDAKKP